MGKNGLKLQKFWETDPNTPWRIGLTKLGKNMKNIWENQLKVKKFARDSFSIIYKKK